MRPAGIVEKAAPNLQPMDHAALFTARGDHRRRVRQRRGRARLLDLPQAPGRHLDRRRLPRQHRRARCPKDCTACHYPLMADAATRRRDQRDALRDEAPLGPAHRSRPARPATPTALGEGTGTPVAATLWQTGAYHPALPPQPTACLDCHAVSARRRRADPEHRRVRAGAGRHRQQRRAVDEPRRRATSPARTAPPATPPTRRRPAAPGASATPFHATVTEPRPPARRATASRNGGGSVRRHQQQPARRAHRTPRP